MDYQRPTSYPVSGGGDLAFILPGQTFCGEENVLNVGSLYWLHVQIEHLDAPGEMLLSKWSGLLEHEGLTKLPRCCWCRTRPFCWR